MSPKPHDGHDHHKDHHHHDHNDYYHHNFDKHSEKAMSWYGWGSASGFGIFIMSIGVFILLLHYAGLIG